MTKKNKLGQIEKFLIKNNIKAEQVLFMKSDASRRRYARIVNGSKNKILMHDPDSRNLRKFLDIAKIFGELDLSVPSIYTEDPDLGFILLEDFGDETYNHYINNNLKYDFLYENAIEVLSVLQKAEIPDNLEIFSQKQILKEVNIFLDWALPYYFEEEISGKLINDFNRNWDEIGKIINSKSKVITHFDYHIDNLVWLKNRSNFKRVGILDFQDALVGPPAYDLVSLLQDARRDVSEELQKKLKEQYLTFYKGTSDEFNFFYDCVGAQRNTRILGVFARLKTRDNKTSYIKHMNRVWRNLNNNLKNPELKNLASCYKYFIPNEIAE